MDFFGFGCKIQVKGRCAHGRGQRWNEVVITACGNPYCWLVPTADFVTPANTQRIESEAFVGIAAEVIRIDGEALEVYSKAFADC